MKVGRIKIWFEKRKNRYKPKILGREIWRCASSRVHKGASFGPFCMTKLPNRKVDTDLIKALPVGFDFYWFWRFNISIQTPQYYANVQEINVACPKTII